MARSALAHRRVCFVDDGLELLIAHYLEHIDGISQNSMRETLEWASYRMDNFTLRPAPADIEVHAKEIVEKMKVRARGANAAHLQKLVVRACRPEMRDYLDSSFATDVPHAVIRLLLLLAQRPTDLPHDFAHKLVERKRAKLAQAAARLQSELEFSDESETWGYSDATASDDASLSEESPVCVPSVPSVPSVPPDSVSVKVQRGNVRTEVEEPAEHSAPLVMPVFFGELKKGHHTTVPEGFVVEDVVALLLGFDADVSTISASISSLHDDTLHEFLDTFRRSAQCLQELRALSRTLKLVLPPIEDHAACEHVTELWQRGSLSMVACIGLPQSPSDGLFGSQPAFGPCWGGFRDALDDMLSEFDHALNTPPPRTLLFLREAIRHRMRIFKRIHSLVEDVFSSSCADSEEMRQVLIARLSEHINICTELTPVWKKVMEPLYEAMERYHAFNLETAGVVDFAPFPLSMRAVEDTGEINASPQRGCNKVLDVIADMPAKCALAKVAGPLRELSQEASRRQASRWLAVPDGPLRQALACFHAVGLCWHGPLLHSIVTLIARGTPIKAAVDTSLTTCLRDETPLTVLQVPASISLRCASRNLSVTDTNSGFRLHWTGGLNAIFDDAAVAHYSQVMELLVSLHWTLFLLPRIVDTDPNFRANSCILCAEMRHFLISLRQYLSLCIEEASNQLQKSIDEIHSGYGYNGEKECTERIRAVHEQFLHETLQGCLLYPEFQSVMENIRGLLTVIREFSANTKHSENVAADFRTRVAFLIKALKWSVATRGLSSSYRVASLVRTVNYNNFYVDM